MKMKVEKDEEGFWCVTDAHGIRVGRYKDDIESVLSHLALLLEDRPQYEFTGNVLSGWGPHSGNDGGFKLEWAAGGIGFGEMVFFVKDGGIHCDNECMSPKFIKALLSDMVDKATLRHWNDD